MKWENQETCSEKETEERLNCLKKQRMLLLSLAGQNCGIKNQARRNSETREAGHLGWAQGEPQKSC